MLDSSMLNKCPVALFRRNVVSMPVCWESESWTKATTDFTQIKNLQTTNILHNINNKKNT